MRVITVASDAELKDPHFYWRVWIAFYFFMNCIPEKQISRRAFLTALSFLFTYGDHYDIRWPDGTPFPIPDVDEIFEDPQMRALSYLLQPSETEPGPHRICNRRLDRLRLIHLFMLIRFPKTAAHF